MYAMMGTRPDLAFAVAALSQFSSNPGQPHWDTIKHVLRYLRGTAGYKLTYGGRPGASLLFDGYCDSDWGSNIDDRRSITGYVFTLGGGAVSWQSKKQPTVALSSVEAEYMAAAQAAREALWWQKLLRELGVARHPATVIHTDSQGSIALSKNPEHHARSKHIDIRHHFIREQVVANHISLQYVPTEDMLADVMTKPLAAATSTTSSSAASASTPSSSAVGVLEIGIADGVESRAEREMKRFRTSEKSVKHAEHSRR